MTENEGIAPRVRARQPTPHDTGVTDSPKEGRPRSSSVSDEKHSRTGSAAQGHKPPRTRPRQPSSNQADARTNSDSAGGDSDVRELEPGSDPGQLHLRIALFMFVRGMTQRQIAAHFERDERTVRRWITKAKDQGLVMSGDLVPDDIVAETVQYFLERKADLLDLKREAEASGDFAARVVCIRELVRTEMAYVSSLDKIGIFEGYRYVPKNSSDPAVEKAEQLRRAAQAVLFPPHAAD